HGQIPRRHGVLFELESAFLECARAEQIIGGHPPDIGLVSLTDGGALGKESFRSESTCCYKAAAGKNQELTPGQSLFHLLISLPFSILDLHFRLIQNYS